MSMVGFKDLFRDYMELGFNLEKYNKLSAFKDFPISNLIFGRFDGMDLRIYYLDRGLTLIIPIQWINLFSDFNNYYRDMEFKFEDDEIDKLAYRFIEFSNYLNYLGDVSEETYSKCFQEIINLGTNKLINYLSKEFELSISPIELAKVNNVIEI